MTSLVFCSYPARLFHQAFISFRKFVLEMTSLPADLHIILSDICYGAGSYFNNSKCWCLHMVTQIYQSLVFVILIAGHIDDIYPYFMRHAKQIFPMLDCMDDLRKISDLRLPANWYLYCSTIQLLLFREMHSMCLSQNPYLGACRFVRYPEARAIQRKVIFHAGPTNSGKTYHAIQRYLAAKSGVYCGPLKLLAHEIFEKSNTAVCLGFRPSNLSCIIITQCKIQWHLKHCPLMHFAVIIQFPTSS